eukprot:12933552-Alexandrium_andersonii.AAC.1
MFVRLGAGPKKPFGKALKRQVRKQVSRGRFGTKSLKRRASRCAPGPYGPPTEGEGKQSGIMRIKASAFGKALRRQRGTNALLAQMDRASRGPGKTRIETHAEASVWKSAEAANGGMRAWASVWPKFGRPLKWQAAECEQRSRFGRALKCRLGRALKRQERTGALLVLMAAPAQGQRTRGAK